MKVHLINKRLITEYLENNKVAKKNLSTWLTIMTNTDWNALPDVNETFGFASKQGREVKFYMPLSNLRIACRYYFQSSRVHILIRRIEIHEVHGD
jgi:mRNA-degrading endonuclease HigB of HigAB toxin-antitoxin module